MLTAAERRALARAVALSAHPPARTSPNPTVGCVLLQDGEVIAEGVTAPPPGPHAEVVALQTAGGRARGATAVVTLEPCAHTGRTPPCSEALLAAGIARVVVAHPDPNPVATGGAARLAAAGVEVVGPLGPEDLWRGTVQRQLEGFLSAATTGRAHVTLKQALTGDGAFLHPDGARWITGPVARRAVHRWRANVDAVLVGVGTVLADDPRLDVRGAPVGPGGGQPRPVVLDTHLRTPPGARLLARGALIVTGETADGEHRRRAARLTAAGAEVVAVPGILTAPADAGAPGIVPVSGAPTAPADAGAPGIVPVSGDPTTPADAAGPRLDLPAALRTVTAHGIVSLLAEPGPTLAGALLDAGLVDRVVRHVAVHLGTGPPVPPTSPPPGGGWELERVGGAGPDLVVQHVRRPPHHPLQHEE